MFFPFPVASTLFALNMGNMGKEDEASMSKQPPIHFMLSGFLQRNKSMHIFSFLSSFFFSALITIFLFLFFSLHTTDPALPPTLSWKRTRKIEIEGTEKFFISGKEKKNDPRSPFQRRGGRRALKLFFCLQSIYVQIYVRTPLDGQAVVEKLAEAMANSRVSEKEGTSCTYVVLCTTSPQFSRFIAALCRAWLFHCLPRPPPSLYITTTQGEGEEATFISNLPGSSF